MPKKKIICSLFFVKKKKKLKDINNTHWSHFLQKLLKRHIFSWLLVRVLKLNWIERNTPKKFLLKILLLLDYMVGVRLCLFIFFFWKIIKELQVDHPFVRRSLAQNFYLFWPFRCFAIVKVGNCVLNNFFFFLFLVIYFLSLNILKNPLKRTKTQDTFLSLSMIFNQYIVLLSEFFFCCLTNDWITFFF